MRIIFLGTPEFAVTCLDVLCKSKHEIVAVVTQPDKPSERGNKIEFSKVKHYALANGLPLFQFLKISRDGVIDLKTLKPDLMVTAAYGQLLSQDILDIPKYGIINVHASLLPKYRGASPIQTAIINGEKRTGVTIMKTDIGLDTGDIIASREIDILEDDTAGMLTEKLSTLGAELLLETIEKIENGTATYEKQDNLHASITHKIKKEDSVINWEKSAKEIVCLINGTNPSPIARTTLKGELVKIYKAVSINFELSNEDNLLSSGSVLSCSSAKRGLFIRTGDKAIEILSMQFPGGKMLDGKALINGRKVSVGDKFETILNHH